MELVNTDDENSFDPTPKLKSSSIPNLFVSLNDEDKNWFYCGDEYTKTLFYYWPIDAIAKNVYHNTFMVGNMYIYNELRMQCAWSE